MTEVYGYSIAVANHGVKHTVLTHLGVTHPYLGGSNEYWSFLDGEGEPGNPAEMNENPCQDPVKVVTPTDPPVAIHFFHQFYAGEAYFTKRSIPPTSSRAITSCSSSERDRLAHCKLAEPRYARSPRLRAQAGLGLVHDAQGDQLLAKQATCARSSYNSYQDFELSKHDY